MKRLGADRRGVASIEAAIVIPAVLLPLAFGTIDLGMTYAAASRLDRALSAAFYYVWANPGAFTTAGLQAAALAAYGNTAPSATVTVSTACSCVSSGYAPVQSAACTATCPNGETLAAYTTVAISVSYTLPVSTAFLSSSEALQVTGTIRTR